jgi:hypothetical protein
MKLLLGLGTLLVSLQVATTPASAETQVAKDVIAKVEGAIATLKTECESDLKSYCSNVSPGEGRIALCMLAHEDKLSDKCFGALFDAAERIDLAVSNIGRAAEICEADIASHCGSVAPGGGRIMQCLIDKSAELSSACRSEVDGFRGRMRKN